jgi:hypothetical protein
MRRLSGQRCMSYLFRKSKSPHILPFRDMPLGDLSALSEEILGHPGAVKRDGLKPKDSILPPLYLANLPLAFAPAGLFDCGSLLAPGADIECIRVGVGAVAADAGGEFAESLLEACDVGAFDLDKFGELARCQSMCSLTMEIQFTSSFFCASK